jgi:hypothetical protein
MVYEIHASKLDVASGCWRERPTAKLLVNREGSFKMEEILRAPVELTVSELDTVAGGGGHGFSFDLTKISVSVWSAPRTDIDQTALVDNSVNISVN